MSTAVNIRILRPLFLRGQRQEAGQVVQASAIDAAMAVATGRAEFVSADDLSQANAGVREETAQQCKKGGSARKSFWNRGD